MSAFEPLERGSSSLWAGNRADRTDAGLDPLGLVMNVGALAHAGSEFAHAAHPPAVHAGSGLGPSSALAPFSLFNGINHIQHSLRDKQGLERVANVAAGGAEALSGGIGTMGLAGHALNAIGLKGAGSALTGLAGSSLLSGLGAVGGSFAAGWSIGTLLDETFGLSDKLSGPGAVQQAGLIQMNRRGTAGIADANQRWVEQEVERLEDEDGDSGVVRQYLAVENKKRSLMDERPLIQSAQAIHQIRKAVRRQQEMAERFHTAQHLARVPGLAGSVGQAMLQGAVEHYAD